MSELENEKLSPHFSLTEMTRTSVPLPNVPDEEQINNLKRVCRWLERLRQRWNDLYGDGDDGIVITSGFRSPAVNKAVGGSPSSNHLTGCAVDIRCIGPEQAIRYAVLMLDIFDLGRQDFDELLIEKKGRGVWWLHFAVRPKNNRRHLNFVR